MLTRCAKPKHESYKFASTVTYADIVYFYYWHLRKRIVRNKMAAYDTITGKSIDFDLPEEL